MAEEAGVGRRRSARLALMEISPAVDNNEAPQETPNKNVSADEMVILLRGPRKKPITWSPVDQEFTPPAKKSPNESKSTEAIPRRPSLNPKIRRRLILSPSKTTSDLGSAVIKKLRELPRLSLDATRSS